MAPDSLTLDPSALTLLLLPLFSVPSRQEFICPTTNSIYSNGPWNFHPLHAFIVSSVSCLRADFPQVVMSSRSTWAGILRKSPAMFPTVDELKAGCKNSPLTGGNLDQDWVKKKDFVYYTEKKIESPKVAANKKNPFSYYCSKRVFTHWYEIL